MSNYSVSLIFSADWGVDVEAESPEEAAEQAYNSDEASLSVCHQCAGHINIGDCIRVIVYDESGNEVLDDGSEQQQIISLKTKVAELEEASVTQKAYYEGVFRDGAKRIAAEQHKVKVLTDALDKSRMLLCEANPSCSSEYLFGVISGAFKRLEEALATVKGE